MTISRRNIGLGVGMAAAMFAVFVLLGYGLGCDKKDEVRPPAAHEGHGHGADAHSEGDGHDHGTLPAKDSHGHDDDGHDDHKPRASTSQAGQAGDACCPPQANLDPKEIEKKVCEHDIRTIDCDECRYELGVVKVDPSVTDALTKTAAVQEVDSGRTLRLTGEVQYDRTTLMDVLPAAAGKVVSVKARLGQKVQAGAILAVVHSGDFSEAKAAYLEAYTSAEVAQQEKSRQSAIADGLE